MSGHGLVPPIDNSWSLERLENNEADADVDLDLAELGAALSEAAMSLSNSRKLKKSKDAGVIGKGQSLKPCMNARKACKSGIFFSVIYVSFCVSSCSAKRQGSYNLEARFFG